MIRYGVIGLGYWGPNLVRVFNSDPRSEVVTVADLSEHNLDRIKVVYPTTATTRDHRQVIDDPRVDVVVVATPVKTHFELALAALKAGKHVFVEKPITDNAESAARLVEEAAKRDRLIFVDHTFVYTGAVMKMKSLIESGSIGDFLYYDSVRINLGLFQSDVNVIWDLAVHDLSILQHLLPVQPREVICQASKVIDGQPESLAYLTLNYDNNIMAHIHVSWLSPVKIRQTLVGGRKRMIVYDDLQPSEKIKIYDKGVELMTNQEEVNRLKVTYRSGDMMAPNLDDTEALVRVASHFNDCIERNAQPVTNGKVGLQIVTLLEAATRSIAKGSAAVSLKV